MNANFGDYTAAMTSCEEPDSDALVEEELSLRLAEHYPSRLHLGAGITCYIGDEQVRLVSNSEELGPDAS